MAKSVVVSACLLGVKCRYDGGDALSLEVDDLLNGAEAIPVCPEELGGLPTPRKRARISLGDGRGVMEGTTNVIDETGKDVTTNFLKGAEEVLSIAKKNSATLALLKEGSPSCGVKIVSRDGVKISGIGVTTAILKRAGIAVIAIS